MTEADWIKALLAGLTTALGVLLGLLGNGYVNWRREKRTYRAMLKAVANEASSNKVVLEESFLRYYETGIVLREFSTATVARCLGDPIFVKHAKVAHLEAVYDYLRNVSLANAYRETSEHLQLDQKDKLQKALVDFVNSWHHNLEQCKKSIETVVAIEGLRKEGGHSINALAGRFDCP
jgi:hypothetical protein